MFKEEEEYSYKLSGQNIDQANIIPELYDFDDEGIVNESYDVVIHQDDLVKQHKRLTSLDVFRGLAMTAMIFIDNPGDANHVIKPFQYSEWDGLTFADCVFPFFLFIMGTSIPLSNYRIWERQNTAKDYWNVWIRFWRRVVVFMVVGFALNFLASSPWNNFPYFRVPGYE
eukprot:TRINITY_DN3644_c0_g1_i1.p1 TRINITY_DN3644_c0_g1~~TRINITY_DN3644_c0_g1_i1.p1  ORF type:complete len:170 (+),score=29.01 TRINITY_DN3644_c0_g1_i1:173-682(+)